MRTPHQLLVSAFSDYASELAASGYSPIPILAGTKRPVLPRWSRLCDEKLADDEIARLAGGNHGLGVACGYRGLIAVDIDTDDARIIAAIRSVLPAPLIGKTGAKGQTLFFHDPSGRIASRSWPGIIDLLSGGRQSVLPPSNHPNGQPYSWTTETKLWEKRSVDLPDLPLNIADQLGEAISSWFHPSSPNHHATLRRPEPQKVNGAVAERYLPYAQAALGGRRRELAAMRPNSGRNAALFAAACHLGRWPLHGILSEREVMAALLDASRANGLLGEDGDRSVLATIRSGLARAANDPLPELEERPRQSPGSGQDTASPPKSEWPQPQSLPVGLPPVAPFDLDLMPDALRGYVGDIAETMQAPPDYVAVAAMVGLGSIVGRKVGIRPQENTTWTEVANQWGVVIGRPGVMKSPAIRAALAPMEALITRAQTDFETAGARHRIEASVAKLRGEEKARLAKDKLKQSGPNTPITDFFSRDDEPDEPRLRRYRTSDATPAALGEILLSSPNGVLVHRDEIVSLLQQLDREDNAEGRGFYLTAWSGSEAYTIDRIGRGLHLHIPAVCVSLLGSTQPGKICRYLHNAVRGGSQDDGLIQRFGLLVWPDVNPDWRDVDRPVNSNAKRQAFSRFQQLDGLDARAIGARQDTGIDGESDGIPYLRLDPAALEQFRHWRAGLERHLRSGELHPALESHLAKYRKLVPSLALISHLADSGTGLVTGAAMTRALAWAGYLETHARRAYASVALPKVQAAKAIGAKIRSGALPASFSSRDVWRPQWSMLTDPAEVKEGLTLLVELDWLSAHSEDTGGRRRTVYCTNPKLHT